MIYHLISHRNLLCKTGPAEKLPRLDDILPENMEIDPPFRVEESHEMIPRPYGYEEGKFKVKFEKTIWESD